MPSKSLQNLPKDLHKKRRHCFSVKNLESWFQLKAYFICIYLKTNVIIKGSDFVNKILIFWVLSTMISHVRTAVSL